jgi:hypothetical protein
MTLIGHTMMCEQAGPHGRTSRRWRVQGADGSDLGACRQGRGTLRAPYITGASVDLADGGDKYL